MRPVTVQLSYDLDQENLLALRPMFNSCSDTNGPSSKVFLDEKGLLNERLPGDPLYWDATDPPPVEHLVYRKRQEIRAVQENPGQIGAES